MGTPERIERALRDNPQWKSRVKVITHDLIAPFTETTKKRIGKVDYIVNFAAESHVERSITDPVPFIHNNVKVATTMLEFAREAKPEVFIQISTDEVYGAAPQGVNHKEWSPILPSNPYSASKACQEAIAISYWRTYGVPVVITNCFDDSVKVFAEKGFVGYEEIEVGDRVWSLNQEGQMVLTPVLEKVKMPNTFGELVEIKTEKASQLVTPNHRMYVQRRFGKAKYSPVEVIEAKEMVGTKKRYKIPTNGNWIGEESELSKEVIALAGWYVSEGYSLPSNGIAFGAASKEQQETIKELCSEYGNAKVNGRSVRIHSKELKEILSEENFGKYAINKKIPSFVKALKPELLRVFFDAAIDGDGSRYESALVYYTKSYQLATDMCEIGMKLGYATRISKRITKTPNKKKEGESFIVRFRVTGAVVEKQNVKTIKSNKDVWCIKTGIGNVFVERDGIVSLSGQTMNNFGETQDAEKYTAKIIKMVKNGESVPVHGTKETIGSRYYLHARNHADAVLYIINNLPPTQYKDSADIIVPDRYNVVGDKELNNLELAEMVAKMMGKELKYHLVDFHSTRAGHDRRYALDGTKLKEKGWNPPMDLETSMKKYIDWSLKNENYEN